MSTLTALNTSSVGNALKVFVVASFVVLIAGWSGCNKSSNPVDNTTSSLVTSLTVPDPSTEPSVVSDSGLQQGCRMHNPDSDHHRIDDFGARFLSRMNLTDSQKTQIIVYVQEHDTCTASAMSVLRASDSTIFAGYQPKFDSIKSDLALGVIDTATARTEYRATLASLRTDLQNNPVRVTTQAALDECRSTFIANVRSVLTTEQLVIFDQWMTLHRR